MELFKMKNEFLINTPNEGKESLALLKEVFENLYLTEIEQVIFFDSKYPHLDLIQCIVSCISRIDLDNLFSISTDLLKQRFNLCKTILKRMSNLNYKELLYMFPPKIKIVEFCDSLDDITSSVAECLEAEGFNVIHFEYKVDNEIGYFLQENHGNDITRNFDRTFRHITEELLNRDENLRSKYSINDLIENLDILL